MESAFTITVDAFTFEALTDSMKGAWDVIRNDGASLLTVGRITLRRDGIDLQPTHPQTRRLLPTQAQMNEFQNQWVAECQRRRQAAAQPALPGAETVRETEIATPAYEAPYSLTRPPSKPHNGKQGGLF